MLIIVNYLLRKISKHTLRIFTLKNEINIKKNINGQRRDVTYLFLLMNGRAKQSKLFLIN